MQEEEIESSLLAPRFFFFFGNRSFLYTFWKFCTDYHFGVREFNKGGSA